MQVVLLVGEEVDAACAQPTEVQLLGLLLPDWMGV